MINDKYKIQEEVLTKSSEGSEDLVSLEEGHPNGLKTEVIIRDHDTGLELFRGSNKTLISGSEFIAMRMFDLHDKSFVTPTYNNRLQLENTINNPNQEEILNNYFVQLFCLGTSGCNRESALKYEVDNKKWIAPEDMVPFQYVPEDKDLDVDNRQIYFGRKELKNKKMVAYYFKKFDSDPTERKQLEDGTPIDATIYDDQSELPAQIIVENTLVITKDDCRDYFINTTGINDARFNCISLCLAYKKESEDGYTYYQDIRPATRINFPNKFLNDLGASWDIIYRIYF